MTPYGAVTEAPGLPAPPAGPGVAPPFGAPPTDRDPKTIWIRLGVSALLLVLCCAGGVVGLGVVVAGTSRQLERQASSLVGDYLGALKREDYRAAYGQLCQSVTDDLSLDRFTQREQARPVTDYTVHDVLAEQELNVTASVSYQGRPPVPRTYVVAIEGQLRICGER